MTERGVIYNHTDFPVAERGVIYTDFHVAERGVIIYNYSDFLVTERSDISLY